MAKAPSIMGRAAPKVMPTSDQLLPWPSLQMAVGPYLSSTAVAGSHKDKRAYSNSAIVITIVEPNRLIPWGGTADMPMTPDIVEMIKPMIAIMIVGERLIRATHRKMLILSLIHI